jgi:hypothetical protein
MKKALPLLMFLTVIVLAIIISLIIKDRNNVSRVLTKAQTYSSQDIVQGLILIVNSDQTSANDKLTAIWAIGQLGDSTVKPALVTAYNNLMNDNVYQGEYDNALTVLNREKSKSRLMAVLFIPKEYRK